jgi:hypothetical protein
MRFVGFLTGEVQHVWMRSSPVSSLLLIRLFQPKSDILGGVQPNTTTAGADLKGPDKHESANRTYSYWHNFSTKKEPRKIHLRF